MALHPPDPARCRNVRGRLLFLGTGTSVGVPVECHFDEGQAPKVIRLHIVRDEILAP